MLFFHRSRIIGLRLASIPLLRFHHPLFASRGKLATKVGLRKNKNRACDQSNDDDGKLYNTPTTVIDNYLFLPGFSQGTLSLLPLLL